MPVAAARQPARTDAIAGSRDAMLDHVAPASPEAKISPDVAPKYSSIDGPSPVDGERLAQDGEKRGVLRQAGLPRGP